MKLYRVFAFLFTSVATGLAAAFVFLLLRPDLFQADHRNLAPASQPAVMLPVGDGPVSYAEAVRLAAPSVVNVFATKITRQQPARLFSDPLLQELFGSRMAQPRYKRENSLGSGVIVDPNGYILTNNHVIENAKDIQIVLGDGRSMDARIVGTDPETDLAVLQAAGGNLPIATLARSAHTQVGDVVLAIGNPFAVGQTVTMGIVSATGRTQLGITAFENFIQTDAAINPGNSGGALVNALGQVVGINTAIFSRSGGSHGIGFAIPIDIARAVLEQIVAKGRVIRGWLGLTGQYIDAATSAHLGLPAQPGILLGSVVEEGPADTAGLQTGDLLTAINGEPIEDAQRLLLEVAGKAPGSRLELTFLRGNDTLHTSAVLAERPPGGG